MCVKYKLKTTLMKSILKKRKKEKPFDLSRSENFFASEDDYNINNSYYFSAHSNKKNESLYIRLAFRGLSVVETWVYFLKDNKSYYLDTLYYPSDKSPLKVKMLKECHYEVGYEGELVNDDNERINAKLSFIFTPTRQVVDFFYHSPEIRTAKAIAAHNWGNGYFDKYKENDQVHYEQVGVINGNIILGNEEFILDLPCCRDHSHGKRDWTYMNNHLWLMGISQTKELNFSMVSYPTMNCLEVGNYFNNDDLYFLRKAKYDRDLFTKDEAPKNFEMDLILTIKKKAHIRVNKIEEKTYLFQYGGYKLIEGICDIEIDGEKIRGILEVGFNKDKSRYFNGLKTGELKI